MDRPVMGVSTGLAAMTLLQQLIETLHDNGAISREDIAEIFEGSAKLHEEVAPEATTEANYDAARILRVVHEDIKRKWD